MLVAGRIETTPPLIHRQRLGQIPREIWIEPSHHAHVIREQLQRQDSQQGADLGVRFGNGNQVVAVGVQAGILFADDDRPCAAHRAKLANYFEVIAACTRFAKFALRALTST